MTGVDTTAGALEVGVCDSPPDGPPARAAGSSPAPHAVTSNSVAAAAAVKTTVRRCERPVRVSSRQEVLIT